MKKLIKAVAACSVVLAMLPGTASAAKFVVGYANMADSDVFPMAVKTAFGEAAKANPDVNVLYADANIDISKQLDQIDNFIAQKVNTIVIVPVDYEGIVPGMYHTTERLQGFTDACLSKRPDVKLLSSLSGNYSRAEGMKVTEDWVQSFPQFDAIIAANDQMALGALQALKTSGRLKGVMISGIDGTADALAAIESGEMSQTIFQNAKGQAETAFQVVQGMMKGETTPPEKLVPFESITKENVAKYKK